MAKQIKCVCGHNKSYHLKNYENYEHCTFPMCTCQKFKDAE